MKNREYSPQLDERLSKVQYWRNGIMLIAQMTITEAKELVESGEAYVISGQAIGAMVDGKKAG